MKVEQTTLANGLRVVTAAMRETRSVAVSIAVGTGSRYENFSLNGGVSHFLEHLLFKGTAEYPSAEAISEAVDEVGGYNNAYTSEDITNYYIKVPARHTELALDILADMIKAPLIDADELDRERGVVVEEMRMWQDDPARFISTLTPDLLFPGNPLGKTIFGPEEVIRTIPRSRVVSYLRRHYHPGNLVVTVAGRLEHEIVVAQVESLLGDLEPGEPAEFKRVGDRLSTQLVASYPKSTAQTHFLVAARGYAFDHPDAAVLRVLAAVLGAGASSRLFMEIRERRGLAYTISCDASSLADTGLFEIYAGATTKKAGEALQAVMDELERLRTEPVPKRELRKAKEQLRASLEMSQESNEAVADRLAKQMILEGRLKPIEETIDEVLAVTAEDIQRVAQTALTPDRLRAAIIAPRPQSVAKLFEQLVSTKKGTPHASATR